MGLKPVLNRIRQFPLASQSVLQAAPIATTQRHPRLSTVLAVSGMIQLLGAIGWVGYGSYQTSTEAIETLADRVLEQVSDRVVEHLGHYTETPKIVTQINENELNDKKFDRSDLSDWNQHLVQQARIFNSLSYIYFGDREGQYVEIQCFGGKRFKYGPGKPDSGPEVSIFPLNENGDRGEVQGRRSYDPRLRPWYQLALRNKKPSWTSIYTFTEEQLTLGISFVRPIYDKEGQVKGVLGADYALLQTQQFLQDLRILKSGQAFILEDNGNLVATSTQENPFQKNLDRMKGEDYPNPVIKTTSEYLQNHLKGDYKIKTPQRLNFQWNTNKQQVRVVPFSDGMGLNWLVVVVIPESDFMGEIDANRRHILVICAIATIVAILSSILTTRWLMRSISALIQSSQKMGAGNLTDPVLMLKRSSWEVMTLSQSLEEMRQELKGARDRLQHYASDLEQDVQHRTQDLTERNLELAETLQGLQMSQDHLIRSEKLASLGKLVASIAHEMNTPLGVIRSSTHNVSTFLHQDLAALVVSLKDLDPSQYVALLGLLQQTLRSDRTQRTLSRAEYRQARQNISDNLATLNVSQPEYVADMLMELGLDSTVEKGLNELQVILEAQQCRALVSALYHVNTSQQSLQAIESATNSAEDVVQALRLYEAQENRGAFVWVDVVESLEMTLKLYENLMRRGVTIDRDYETVPLVWGCPPELNRVWTNLVHNALQAMDCQGHLQLHLRVQGAVVVVSIANDGPTIAPDVLPHLFEPFFTTRSQGEGKGMGLTIVRRILEKHHGQIVLADVTDVADMADMTDATDATDEVSPFNTRFIVTLPTDFRNRGVVL